MVACELMTWRPIEGAPKDGADILAFGQGVDGFPMLWDSDKPRTPMCLVVRWVEGWYEKDVEVSPGLFRKERTLGYSYWGPHPQQFIPSHWMPLPDPPEAA